MLTKKKEPTYHPPIHAFPIYGLLICSFILLVLGIYFQLGNIKISGNDGENSFGINGPSLICFGIAMSIFPFYILIKQYREKKKFDKNIF
jgi:hypothetical protein